MKHPEVAIEALALSVFEYRKTAMEERFEISSSQFANSPIRQFRLFVSPSKILESELDHRDEDCVDQTLTEPRAGQFVEAACN